MKFENRLCRIIAGMNIKRADQRGWVNPTNSGAAICHDGCNLILNKTFRTYKLIYIDWNSNMSDRKIVLNLRIGSPQVMLDYHGNCLHGTYLVSINCQCWTWNWENHNHSEKITILDIDTSMLAFKSMLKSLLQFLIKYYAPKCHKLCNLMALVR